MGVGSMRVGKHLIRDLLRTSAVLACSSTVQCDPVRLT